ncbi:hypothetical protein [Sulfobacillus harzensis]|uniref:Uncharacterized protein n=1 Tax=Sulfobacillus harzensis TaxID=2729629 RepID=A0A7Y0L5H9_9FIRM|nr:hypothetical protein [Sulfobacillus harzensis]NMP23413.1 hypothetical protein [Sulfobacillus harzensis]
MPNTLAYRITYSRCAVCGKVYWSSPAHPNGRLAAIRHQYYHHAQANAAETVQYQSLTVYRMEPDDTQQHAS